MEAVTVHLIQEALAQFMLRQSLGETSHKSKDQYRKPETPKAKGLNSKQREELLGALQARFEKNINRHKGLELSKIRQFPDDVSK